MFGPMPLRDSRTCTTRRLTSVASTSRWISPGYGRSTGGLIGVIGAMALGPGLLCAIARAAAKRMLSGNPIMLAFIDDPCSALRSDELVRALELAF